MGWCAKFRDWAVLGVRGGKIEQDLRWVCGWAWWGSEENDNEVEKSLFFAVVMIAVC